MGLESARYSAQVAGQIPEDGLLCAPCRMAAPPFARAVAYGAYEDELRELVQLLKYEGMRSLAEPLGLRLAEAIEMLAGSAAPDLLVVAVPLFPANERARGYNQSVLLANVALWELRRSHPAWRLIAGHSALQRVKATRSQFLFTPKGRRRNLQGAFSVPDPATVMGREVLLVDDIYTTGATARACAGALQRAGARKVWVATVARAQREQVEFWDEYG